MNGAESATLTCVGLVTAQEAPLRMPSHCLSPTCPFTRGNIQIGTRGDTNALVTHVQTLDRQILCTLDCRPRQRLRFRTALDVNLLPHRATILILTGTSVPFSTRSRLRTPRSIYSWYHRTSPVSSHPYPLNVFIKLCRFYFTAMIRR